YALITTWIKEIENSGENKISKAITNEPAMKKPIRFFDDKFEALVIELNICENRDTAELPKLLCVVSSFGLVFEITGFGRRLKPVTG
ncbi:15526_t:CDS:2, partial [Gigaspora rosea]